MMKYMKKDAVRLFLFVVACELVGLSGTPFTAAAIPTWYQSLNKPFFSPPNWVFGPVWTVLYALMGISVFLLVKKGVKKTKTKQAIQLFCIQLLFNWIWTPVFFGLRSPVLGAIILMSLFVTLLLTIWKSYRVSRLAGYLLLPYFAWVSFALLLNISIVVLQ